MLLCEMLNFLVSALNSVAMIVGLWDEKIRVRSSGRLKGPLCTTSTQDYSEAMIFFCILMSHHWLWTSRLCFHSIGLHYCTTDLFKLSIF